MGYKVDIWNLGVLVSRIEILHLGILPAVNYLVLICQVWELFEDYHLFKGRNSKNDLLDDRYHLGEMVAIPSSSTHRFS